MYAHSMVHEACMHRAQVCWCSATAVQKDCILVIKLVNYSNKIKHKFTYVSISKEISELNPVDEIP